jgi:hypothetical protein
MQHNEKNKRKKMIFAENDKIVKWFEELSGGRGRMPSSRGNAHGPTAFFASVKIKHRSGL